MRDDIVWWKIGYCPDGKYKERVIIPSFDLKGNLNYFIARSYTSGEWQKYKNPPASRNIIFNELYLDFDEDLILVEGVFDAIKVDIKMSPASGSLSSIENSLTGMRPSVFRPISTSTASLSIRMTVAGMTWPSCIALAAVDDSNIAAKSSVEGLKLSDIWVPSGGSNGSRQACTIAACSERPESVVSCI